MADIVCYTQSGALLENLYQWDTNVKIKITGFEYDVLPEFHFCNRLSKEAVSVIPSTTGGALVATVPDSLLRQPEVLIVYICHDSRTIEIVRIPVLPRVKPADVDGQERYIKTGSTIVDTPCESFNIKTGLINIDMVSVVRTNILSGENGTWGWLNSSAGNMTNYNSNNGTLNTPYGQRSSRVTINRDGSITITQYSSSYPIQAGEYNWVVAGS